MSAFTSITAIRSASTCCTIIKQGMSHIRSRMKAVNILLLPLVWLGLLTGGMAATAAAKDAVVGTFTIIRGSVDALHAAVSRPEPVVKGQSAFLHDVIRTKRRSRARLGFTDGSVLNMGSNQKIHVQEYAYNKKKETRHVIVETLRGSIRATVSKVTGDSVFQVKTPTAIISVRGTDFIVQVGPDGMTTVTVISGIVNVRNEFGMVTLNAGQQSTVSKGKTPAPPVKVGNRMMSVLLNATRVEGYKGNGQSAGFTGEPAMSSSLPVKIPAHTLQQVHTGNRQDTLDIQQPTSPGRAAPWTFATKPITESVPNVQGCPAGQSWQQAPNTCSVGGGVCAAAGAPCNQGTCKAGPSATFACLPASGGPCAGIGAACPPGDTCTQVAPAGSDRCSTDGSVCSTPGSACGGGTCLAGAFGCR